MDVTAWCVSYWFQIFFRKTRIVLKSEIRRKTVTSTKPYARCGLLCYVFDVCDFLKIRFRPTTAIRITGFHYSFRGFFRFTSSTAFELIN